MYSHFKDFIISSPSRDASWFFPRIYSEVPYYDKQSFLTIRCPCICCECGTYGTHCQKLILGEIECYITLCPWMIAHRHTLECASESLQKFYIFKIQALVVKSIWRGHIFWVIQCQPEPKYTTLGRSTRARHPLVAKAEVYERASGRGEEGGSVQSSRWGKRVPVGSSKVPSNCADETWRPLITDTTWLESSLPWRPSTWSWSSAFLT